MNVREREVRKCAADLLARLCVTSPPVDPDWIACRQGLKVTESSLPNGVYAALWKEGDRFGIVLSDSCPTSGHRRFSLAHELGHYNLDGHLEQMGPATLGTRLIANGLGLDQRHQAEAEANWFASELLAPTDQAAPRVRKMRPSIYAIRSLAREFHTSLTMMAIRYAELTDRIVASVLSFEGRVDRMTPSQRFRELDWTGSLAVGDPVPHGTVASGLTRDSKALTGGETRSVRVLARDWFDGAPPALEIDEESVWLGSYGRVLTLLVAG